MVPMPKHIPKIRHQNAGVGQQLLDDKVHTLYIGTIARKIRLPVEGVVGHGD